MRILLTSHYLVLLLLLLTACAHRSSDPTLTSLQLVDRSGFAETISAKDRLKNYASQDFLASQPYEKVVRVFGKDKEGHTSSVLTTYHPNGSLYQYLETVEGRAFGSYKEYFSTGRLKCDFHLIEGMPDLAEEAMTSWVFEGLNRVFDEEGSLQAEILYSKGALEGNSYYYHPNGTLQKRIPYKNNLVHGTVEEFDDKGFLIATASFDKGKEEGKADRLWSRNQILFEEEYSQGNLLSANYFDSTGALISSVENGKGKKALFVGTYLSSLIEIEGGQVNGLISEFAPNGKLERTYTIKEEKKEGEELVYYPDSKLKLSIQWKNDTISGLVRTWYPQGELESQREMQDNKKHGRAFAYFNDGSLMLAEEYENDKLVKGAYFKKGSKTPESRIESGSGIATLFDAEGRLLQKISYERSSPVKN